MKLARVWQSAAVRGIAATSIVKYGGKIAVFVRLILVTQFLLPADLGRFGLSMLLVSVAEVFTETGINLVLLRHPDSLKKYLNTAWALSLVRGGLIALALVLLAPMVARFYHDSLIVSAIMLAALIPLIRGALNPAIITYQQHLRFGSESLLRSGLQVVDILVGLFFAYLWRSGNGLIMGVIASATLELVLSFLLFTQRPAFWLAKWSQVRELYSQTKYIIGTGILHYLTENVDDLLIGRLFGTSSLGLYQTAYSLASSLTNDIGSTIGQILYPIYALRQRQKISLLKLWQVSTLAMVGWYLLGAVGVWFIAPRVLPLLLGPEWLGTIPLIQLLFVAGALKSFVTAWNPLALLAHHLRDYLVLNTVHMLSMVVGILLLQPWGIMGAGWAVLFAGIAILPLGMLVTRKSLAALERNVT